MASTIVLLFLLLLYALYMKKKTDFIPSINEVFYSHYFFGFWYAFMAIILESFKVFSFGTYMAIKDTLIVSAFSTLYWFILIVWVLGIGNAVKIKKDDALFVVTHGFSFFTFNRIIALILIIMGFVNGFVSPMLNPIQYQSYMFWDGLVSMILLAIVIGGYWFNAYNVVHCFSHYMKHVFPMGNNIEDIDKALEVLFSRFTESYNKEVLSDCSYAYHVFAKRILQGSGLFFQIKDLEEIKLAAIISYRDNLKEAKVEGVTTR